MMIKIADLQSFSIFLEKHGAEIRDPTNPYEILRYRTPDGVTHVAYRNKKEKQTLTKETVAHYGCFKADVAPWLAISKSSKPKQRSGAQTLQLKANQPPTCDLCRQFCKPGEARHDACAKEFARAKGVPKLESIIVRLLREATASCAPWEGIDAAKVVQEGLLQLKKLQSNKKL